MIAKIIKYGKSIARVIKLKIIYGKKLKVKISSIKSIYIGKSVRVKINNGNALSLGNNVYIDDYCSFECICGNIYVGDNTFFNTNNKIVSLKKISIGSNCLFGPNIGIFDHDHKFDNIDLPIILQGYEKGEINIGNDIWIGSNCIITRGIRISDKVVIAANSVVTKSIQDSGVFGGIPAKLIRKL